MATKKSKDSNVRVSTDNLDNTKDSILKDYKIKLDSALSIIEELKKEKEDYIKQIKLLTSQVDLINKKLDNAVKYRAFTDISRKKISLSYNFDNMPIGKYYSKYKRILRAACDTTVMGNLQEGLNVFKTIKIQNIPKEYKEMIEKNIEEISFYIKNYYYNSLD